MPAVPVRFVRFATVFVGVVAVSSGLSGQNCPADLEWPATAQASPGTTNLRAVAVWPTSLEMRSVITDRHANARASLLTPTTAPPAVGSTICDPTFQTSITRITPTGYSLMSDAFSAGGGWVMTISMNGAPTAFEIDSTTGRPRMVNGQPRSITINAEMLPQSPQETVCQLGGTFWSRKEEGVLYMVACGTRLFKYNLARFDPAKPTSGLMAGSGPRSIARWPNCTGNCRQGPVFLSFDDLFAAQTKDGYTGAITVGVDGQDSVFTGFVNAYAGYKNVRSIFVYRPLNNSIWVSRGPADETVPFLATGRFNGAAINKRIIGTQTDHSGRYLSLATCGDAVNSLSGCGTGVTYIIDLNTANQGSNLAAMNPNGVDQVSHGSVGTGVRLGSNSVTQDLAVSYFTNTMEKKLLKLPDLVGPTGWWGSYTDTGAVLGASGFPLASAHSTYSYERIFGNPSPLSSCPSRQCVYANELILFNTSGTRFIRLAHNQSRLDDYAIGAYWDYPRVSISRDGRFVVFVSNWGAQSTQTQVRYAVYLVRVPAAWRMLLEDTVTVNTSLATVPVGGYSVLTVSHAQSASGANVLLQDATQPAAVRATSCLFQVTKNRSIQLANNSGDFTNSMRGPIGSPSAGVLENSRCVIDIAGSSVEGTLNGNVHYRLRIAYKSPFASKSIRAIAQTIGASTWIDGSRVAVRPSSFSFVTPPARTADDEIAAPEILHRSYETLQPGYSLEFPLEDPEPMQFTLTDDRSPITLRVARTEDGVPRFEVHEESRLLASLPDVKAGAMVRVDYRADGRLAILLDGTEVVTAYGPASREGLYLLTDRINPQLRLIGNE